MKICFDTDVVVSLQRMGSSTTGYQDQLGHVFTCGLIYPRSVEFCPSQSFNAILNPVWSTAHSHRLIRSTCCLFLLLFQALPDYSTVSSRDPPCRRVYCGHHCRHCSLCAIQNATHGHDLDALWSLRDHQRDSINLQVVQRRWRDLIRNIPELIYAVT